MHKLLPIAAFIITCNTLLGQGFELYDFNAQAKANIGESLSIPLKIRNNTDKTIHLVIQEIKETLGSTQKHNFCINDNCLETSVKEFNKRLEPAESLTNLIIQIEAGLLPGQGSIHYRIYNKNNPLDVTEVEIQVFVEEKITKNILYKTIFILSTNIFLESSGKLINHSRKMLWCK